MVRIGKRVMGTALVVVVAGAVAITMAVGPRPAAGPETSPGPGPAGSPTGSPAGSLALGSPAAPAASIRVDASASPAAGQGAARSHGAESYLFSVTSTAGTITGVGADTGNEQLTLKMTGVQGYVTQFADRPFRDAYVLSTADFAARWSRWFGTVAPNAVLTFQLPDDPLPRSIVLELTLPVFDPAGGALAFTARHLHRSLSLSADAVEQVPLPLIAAPAAFTSASLFIDDTVSDLATSLALQFPGRQVLVLTPYTAADGWPSWATTEYGTGPAWADPNQYYMSFGQASGPNNLISNGQSLCGLGPGPGAAHTYVGPFPDFWSCSDAQNAASVGAFESIVSTSNPSYYSMNSGACTSDEATAIVAAMHAWSGWPNYATRNDLAVTPGTCLAYYQLATDSSGVIQHRTYAANQDMPMVFGGPDPNVFHMKLDLATGTWTLVQITGSGYFGP
ncbi:MAG: hypothetical protein WCK58_00965 [Chloroflexota bacterium]